jgi:hypothetical protein
MQVGPVISSREVDPQPTQQMRMGENVNDGSRTCALFIEQVPHTEPA